MSEANGASDQVDNWVFDSLVNFLHGSIWKVPVVGFIEEKSVVFDPDSYNNMTEEKEEEFRKIHDGYKTVVDFMLTSFMEDLQVTPEQVEEACRVREHQSKTLPESHITKIALEQLWAAEDFTAFRRLMTRKNIDLQLQSLELLVAKYGVLSPALRSGDSEDPIGEDGEDDFLQVVIRYSDQLETFKCDYGAEATSPGFSCRSNEETSSSPLNGSSKQRNCLLEGGSVVLDEKNMQLHLSGFKNIAPTPILYQATLTSSPPRSSPKSSNDHPSSSSATVERQPSLVVANDTENIDIESSQPQLPIKDKEAVLHEDNDQNFNTSESGPIDYTAVPTEEPESPQHDQDPSDTLPTHDSPTPPPSPSPPNDTSIIDDESQAQVYTEPTAVKNHEHAIIEENSESSLPPETESPVADVEKTEESQLIQLEEAEAAIDEETNIGIENALTEQASSSPPTTKPRNEPLPMLAPLVSSYSDDKTAAEIASTAPEQRRLLTAVRKALEINPEDSEAASASINIPKSMENDEDLHKRREYLRAQRDKLIAMKKLEREKLLLANSSDSGGQQSARPKSARAAQIAIKNPNNMRAASLSERSLSARRALADRLKQELIEK